MPFDKESVAGWLGFSAQGKRVLADTAGFFGWSAGRTTNLLLSFLPPPGASTIRIPLTITLAYGNNSVTISYNPDFPRIERQLPTNTPISVTITTASAFYAPASDTFIIATNQVVSRVIQLEFAQASIATITESFFF